MCLKLGHDGPKTSSPVKIRGTLRSEEVLVDTFVPYTKSYFLDALLECLSKRTLGCEKHGCVGSKLVHPLRSVKNLVNAKVTCFTSYS